VSAPVGSLGAEAALLLDAIAGRLEALRPTDGGDGQDDRAAEPTATGAPTGCPQCGHDPSATVTCTACPLCRLLAVLRGERPETTARLVEGALVVVQSLRALLPEPAGAGEAPPAAAKEPSTSGPTVAPAPSPAHAGPTTGGLERIIVR
jgi:hypothetical protein